LRGWYDKYEKQGFTIVGVHSPEFFWERPLNKVKAAAEQLGVRYPIVQDNGLRFGSVTDLAWPTTILIDKKESFTGMSARRHEKTEAFINQLWRRKTLANPSAKTA
jgi:hypothetical protein